MSFTTLYIRYRTLLLSAVLTLFSCSLFSQKKSYLYGVPPAPPFQKAEVKIKEDPTDGCAVPKEPLIGYIISVNEESFTDYRVILQDENGVRHKCYIDTNLTSNYDMSWLNYTLIPGNKVRLKVEYCGSGGFIYVLHIKNLKRT